MYVARLCVCVRMYLSIVLRRFACVSPAGHVETRMSPSSLTLRGCRQ